MAWLCSCIVLFTFQKPLEDVCRIFKYLDELCAVVSFGIVIWHRDRLMQWIQNDWAKVLLLAMTAFLASGLAGNVIYHYQPLAYVLLDLFTNVKFYIVLASAMLLFSSETIQENSVRKLVYVLSSALFILFVFDRIFSIWPEEIRLGISSASMIYGEPTYLAGAMAGLLGILLITYVPNNLPFILMDVVMMGCTMRMKAIGGAAVLIALLVWVIWLGKKVKLWYLVGAACTMLLLAWKQIYFYFFTFSHNARAVLTKTSIRILGDYFPIGTGFGTYASNAANVHYSPVYEKYGFLTDYLISPTENEILEYFAGEHKSFIYQIGNRYVYNELGPKSSFLNDTFWPIILGQTGFIGTVAYLLILVILFVRLWKIQSEYRNLFAGGMFLMSYLLICSTSEPAFNNAMAIPFALMLGICYAAEFRNTKSQKENNDGYQET